MLDNLIYCLNATVPIFLLMVLGVFLRQVGFLDQQLADKLNSFVFKVGLPVMLYKDLVESDFFAVWDLPFVLFCFFSTLLSVFIAGAVSRVLKNRSLGGEFIQVSYRSSIALLGAAFLENIYGNAGAASLVIIGAVPLYNVAAVVVLSLASSKQKGVDRNLIEEAVSLVQERDGRQEEGKMIQRLLEKRHFDPEEADLTERRKVQAFLMRKGFTAEGIRRAMKGTLPNWE